MCHRSWQCVHWRKICSTRTCHQTRNFEMPSKSGETIQSVTHFQDRYFDNNPVECLIGARICSTHFIQIQCAMVLQTRFQQIGALTFFQALATVAIERQPHYAYFNGSLICYFAWIDSYWSTRSIVSYQSNCANAMCACLHSTKRHHTIYWELIPIACSFIRLQCAQHTLAEYQMQAKPNWRHKTSANTLFPRTDFRLVLVIWFRVEIHIEVHLIGDVRASTVNPPKIISIKAQVKTWVKCAPIEIEK